MGIIQGMLGHASSETIDKAKKEFGDMLIRNEEIRQIDAEEGLKLKFGDGFTMTSEEIISKHPLLSVPVIV